MRIGGVDGAVIRTEHGGIARKYPVRHPKSQSLLRDLDRFSQTLGRPTSVTDIVHYQESTLRGQAFTPEAGNLLGPDVSVLEGVENRDAKCLSHESGPFRRSGIRTDDAIDPLAIVQAKGVRHDVRGGNNDAIVD